MMDACRRLSALVLAAVVRSIVALAELASSIRRIVDPAAGAQRRRRRRFRLARSSGGRAPEVDIQLAEAQVSLGARLQV